MPLTQDILYQNQSLRLGLIRIGPEHNIMLRYETGKVIFNLMEQRHIHFQSSLKSGVIG